MNTITIEGQLRTEFGKSATKRIRSQEMVPGVIYGGAKEINFSTPLKTLKPFIYTSEFMYADITIDGKTYHCILKDLQFDKISDEIIHFDLLELVEGKKVIADIPIHFTGSAVGVKEGGKLIPKLKSLKVKTEPKYLIAFIEINVDALELNKSIRVEDVKIPNFEILNSPRIPIVSVGLTRTLKEETTTTAAAAGTPEAAPAADAKKEGAAPAADTKGKAPAADSKGKDKK